MTVHVQHSHIFAGVPNNPCRCPVARAVRDALGIPQEPYGNPDVDIGGVDVSARMVTVRHPGTTQDTRYDMPLSAWRAVQGFDRDKRMTPFQFELVERPASLGEFVRPRL